MEAKFYIAKMDCPTEEQLIRNRLGSMEGVEQLRVRTTRRSGAPNWGISGAHEALE